jgi:hypothetical protein
MKISYRLLVSTCMITNWCHWGADELNFSQKTREQTTQTNAERITETKNTPPQAQNKTRTATLSKANKEEESARSRAIALENISIMEPQVLFIPTDVPTLTFAMQQMHQNLVVNLEVEGVCVSHEIELDTFRKSGSRQVYVSGNFVTTLVPADNDFVSIHIMRLNRTIVEGRYKIDSLRRVLHVDTLSLDKDLTLSYDGDIVVNRIRTAEDSIAKLYLKCTNSAILGSDVAAHFGELCVSAKTFRNKGNIFVHSFKMILTELINEGDLVCRDKFEIGMNNCFTNNGTVKVSEMELNTATFVNDGIFIAKAFKLNASENFRNSKLLKTNALQIDCKKEFLNSGGERDNACLVDKNPPENLWGVHSETMTISCDTLNNREGGIIWAYKQIKINAKTVNNCGYLRSLEDIYLDCLSYQDTAQVVLRRDARERVNQQLKAPLVAYKTLKMIVDDGNIASSIYGEHSIELFLWAFAEFEDRQLRGYYDSG